MSVVFGLADKIAVLVYGEVIACDTPANIRSNAAVQAAYLLAGDLTVETGMQCLAAVQQEAERLGTLYEVKRDRFELQIVASMTTLAAIDLGAVVQLQWKRFGLSAGKLFRVIGYQLDPASKTISLTVWG